MKKLTKRQREVLAFISKFIETNKCPPTIQEVAQKFNIKSSSAFAHVKALVKKERLTKNRSPRSMRIVKNDDSLYGYSIVSVEQELDGRICPIFVLVRSDMETGDVEQIAQFVDYGAVLRFMDEVGYGKVTEDMGSNESSNV